jgi:hypothetical protein
VVGRGKLIDDDNLVRRRMVRSWGNGGIGFGEFSIIIKFELINN